MRKSVRSLIIAVAVAVGAAAMLPASAPVAYAKSGAELSREANAALRNLLNKQKSARMLAQRATAILVFPSIVKAGFMFGGQIGEGAAPQGREDGRLLQLGRAPRTGSRPAVQTFGYALFFMNEHGAEAARASEGFEIGVGPSIVIVDRGHGEVAHQQHAHERRLRVHLRPEGADGRARHPGIEDHEDLQVGEEEARHDANECSSPPRSP